MIILTNHLLYLQVHLIFARSSDDLASHHFFVLIVDPLKFFFLLVTSHSSNGKEISSNELFCQALPRRIVKASLKLICQVMPRKLVKKVKFQSEISSRNSNEQSLKLNKTQLDLYQAFVIVIMNFCAYHVFVYFNQILPYSLETLSTMTMRIMKLTKLMLPTCTLTCSMMSPLTKTLSLVRIYPKPLFMKYMMSPRTVIYPKTLFMMSMMLSLSPNMEAFDDGSSLDP